MMTTTIAQAVTTPLSAPVCRVCGSNLTQTFLDLGDMPLANSYLTRPSDPDPSYPLHARVCDACLLVQADPIVSPADIFCDYPFASAMSSPWVAHCRDYVEKVTERFGLDDQSRVIEIASNDGTLLEQFHGPDVLGVDPARNVAEQATVPTIVQFFTQELAHELGKFDLVIANNVLGHVPDLNDFVGGLSVLLGRDGVLTIEVPWLYHLIERGEFDTIYHEHFSYFSLYALEHCLARHRLHVFDVEQLAIHGGSIRVYATRNPHRLPGAHVQGVRVLEEQSGLTTAGSVPYRNFAGRVRKQIAALMHFFDVESAAGNVVAGAGAPAKANTLLNAARATMADVQWVTDTSPHKQGRYLPGSHIPVMAPDAMFTYPQPDTVVVLAWNWFDAIVESFAGLDATFVHPLRLA